MSFRSSARPAVRLAHRMLVRLWSAGFSVLGRASRSVPRMWSASGGRAVVVVAPHPDDEAIGCGGTIALHVLAGDRVCVCIATDGRRSRVDPDSLRMAARRREEAVEAARLLGVERLEWLGLPEGECRAADITQRLGPLLGELQPAIIYAPSRIDFHPEHFKVAHAVASAIAQCGGGVREPTVRIYQVQVPLSIVCNLVSDVSKMSDRSEELIAAYSSQATVIRSAARQRRYGALRHRTGLSVEEFWEMPAADYVTLHADAPDGWPSAFRGLRNRPWTDPLAYLVGRGERRRLLELTRRAIALRSSTAH